MAKGTDRLTGVGCGFMTASYASSQVCRQTLIKPLAPASVTRLTFSVFASLLANSQTYEGVSMFQQHTSKLPQYVVTAVIVLFVWNNPAKAAQMFNHAVDVIQSLANHIG
jgi:hypothetical protein